MDLVDLPLKLISNHLEMNKKMWGLLLSVVFADVLKSSMGSSLGSDPPDMLQEKKRKQHSKSLTCCFDALTLKKWKIGLKSCRSEAMKLQEKNEKSRKNVNVVLVIF